MNKKSLFGILDNGDGTGAGIDKVDPDVTLASGISCTMAVPVFQNSAGVLVFPTLTADGKLPVTSDSAGSCFNAYAKVTGSTSDQDLGSITITADEVYKNIGVSIAAATEACVELVYIDDAGGTPAETVLACYNLGPGQYSFGNELSCLELNTAGGTGDQILKLRGKLLESTGAEICGTVSTLQVA